MTTKSAIEIPVEQIAEDLAAEDLSLTLEEQKRIAPKSWWVSHLAHPCEAYPYFMRTAWREAELMSPEVEDRVRVGREREPFVLDRVQRVATRIGAEVRRVRETYHDDEIDAGGEVDALLRMNHGNRYGLPARTQLVLEVKTVSPYIWDGCRDLAALRAHEWLGRYFAQVTLYMYLSGIEFGLFVLENLNGQRRYLGFRLDYALADALIAKAKRLTEAKEKSEPPARIAQPSVCRGCPVFAACQPPLMYGPGAEFADEAGFIAGLEERARLERAVDQAAVKALKKADDAVKATAKAAAEKLGTDTLIVGDWTIQLKRQKNGTRVLIQPLTVGSPDGSADSGIA